MQKITLDTTYDAIFKEVYKIVKDRLLTFNCLTLTMFWRCMNWLLLK